MVFTNVFTNDWKLYELCLFFYQTYRDWSPWKSNKYRDVTAGATGVTAVAPKFSDTLTLFQPGGADSTQHCRGCTKNSPTFFIDKNHQNNAFCRISILKFEKFQVLMVCQCWSIFKFENSKQTPLVQNSSYFPMKILRIDHCEPADDAAKIRGKLH